MKSNIISLSLAGMLSIGMFSCNEDFLDTPPVGAYTEDNYIRDLEELETLLYSCYSVLGGYFTYPGSLVNMGVSLFVFGDIGSDNAEKGSWPDDQKEMQDVSMSSLLPGNRWPDIIWRINYDLIGKCNLVLDKSTEIEVGEDETARLEISFNLPLSFLFLPPNKLILPPLLNYSNMEILIWLLFY